MNLLAKLISLESLIGCSPLHKLTSIKSNLFCKLEYNNFMGSIKDRPAFFMLKNAIKNNQVNSETTVIESSSGNFALALAGICKQIGLDFVAVIDANIVAEKEILLNLLSTQVVKISERDHTGGYLLNRIASVRGFMEGKTNCFNPNQYENPDNYFSYYYTLGNEICTSFSRLDYVFISVSSGGTVTGLSLRLKEKYKNVKVIAVDVEGSIVFSDNKKTRKLSGLGSSLRSKIIENAIIDDVIILSEQEIIGGCHALLAQEGILAGASSGAAYAAAKFYLNKHGSHLDNSLIIIPDRGNAYIDTVYNNKWICETILTHEKHTLPQ